MSEALPVCPNCERALVLDGTVHFAPVGMQPVAMCACGVRAGLMRTKTGDWEVVWVQFPGPVVARVIDPEASS